MGQTVRRSPRRSPPALDSGRSRGGARPKSLTQTDHQQTYLTRDMTAQAPRARRLHK